MKITALDEIKITVEDGELSVVMVGVNLSGAKNIVTNGDYIEAVFATVLEEVKKSQGYNEPFKQTNLVAPYKP